LVFLIIKIIATTPDKRGALVFAVDAPLQSSTDEDTAPPKMKLSSSCRERGSHGR